MSGVSIFGRAGGDAEGPAEGPAGGPAGGLAGGPAGGVAGGVAGGADSVRALRLPTGFAPPSTKPHFLTHVLI